MGSPLAGLYGAAGAYEGLQNLLARRMLERQQAERERAARAAELLKQREIDEMSATRRTQQTALNEYRQGQLELSRQARTQADDRDARLARQFQETNDRLNQQFQSTLGTRANEMDLRERIATMQNDMAQGRLDVQRGGLAVQQLGNELARMRYERENNPEFARMLAEARAQGAKEGATNAPGIGRQLLGGLFPKIFGQTQTLPPLPTVPASPMSGVPLPGAPQPLGPPAPDAGALPSKPTHYVGERVRYGGRTVTITKIHPNGQDFEYR